MPTTKPQRQQIEKGVFRQPRQDYLEESVSQLTLERDSLCKVSDFEVPNRPKLNLPELCAVDGKGRAIYWLYKHNLADSASIRQRLRNNYANNENTVLYDQNPCCDVFTNVQSVGERARTALRRLRLKKEMCRLKDLFLNVPKSDIEIVETYNSYMNLNDLEAIQLYLNSDDSLGEDKYDNLLLNLKLKNSLIHTAQKNTRSNLENLLDVSSNTTAKATEHQRVQLEKMLKRYAVHNGKKRSFRHFKESEVAEVADVKPVPTNEFKSLPGISFNDLDHILNQLRHFVRGDKHSKITETQKEKLEKYLKSIADESLELEIKRSGQVKQINEGLGKALNVSMKNKTSSVETQFGSYAAPSTISGNLLNECEQNVNMSNFTYEDLTTIKEFDHETTDGESKEMDSKTEDTNTNDGDDILDVFDDINSEKAATHFVENVDCEKFIESLEINMQERIREHRHDESETGENIDSTNERIKIEDRRSKKRERKRDDHSETVDENKKSKPKKKKPKHCEITVTNFSGNVDDNRNVAETDVNESKPKSKHCNSSHRKRGMFAKSSKTDEEVVPADRSDGPRTYSMNTALKEIYQKIPYICFADDMQISSDSCYEQTESDKRISRLAHLKYKRRKIKAISEGHVKDDETPKSKPPLKGYREWLSQSEKCMEKQRDDADEVENFEKKKHERKTRHDDENEQINRKVLKPHNSKRKKPKEERHFKNIVEEKYTSEEMINNIDYREYYESEVYGRCEKGEEQPFYMLKVDGKSHNNYEYEIKKEVNESECKRKDEESKRRSRRREKRILDRESCKAFGTAIDFDLYRFESDDQSEKCEKAKEKINRKWRDDCKRTLGEKCKLYTSDEIDTDDRLQDTDYDVDNFDYSMKCSKRSHFKDRYDHSYGFEDYSLQEKDEDTLANGEESDYTKALGLRNIVYEEDDADSDHTLKINNSLIHLDDSMFKTPANVSLEDFLAHEVECKSQEKNNEYDENVNNLMKYNGHITNIAIFNKGCKIGKISTNTCCPEGKMKKLNKSTQMFEHVTKNDLYTLQWIHDNLFEININPHTLIVDEKIKEISEVSHIS